MNEILSSILVWAAGVALGMLFFGGLWWTVRKGVSAKNPALWFTGSSLIRTGIVLAGFYFIASRHWDRLLLCLLGFTMAAVIITVFTRPAKKAPCQAEKADHAH
jgi:F1F0 ATPase subunit 2